MKIERKRYLERLRGVCGTADIKVITGVRRSGKTMLMMDFMSEIEANPSNNVIFIDYTDLRNESLKDYHALHEFVLRRTDRRRKNFVFIDEVQMCAGFEKAVNSLHTARKYDIYITGSNAFLLSSDLATLFTGRFFEVHVLPFDFREYMEWHGTGDVDTAFDRYFEDGGLAGAYDYPNLRDRRRYAKSVFDTILTRDLTQKYRISESVLLKRLSEFMLDNVGNLASIRNISGTLTSSGLKTNHETVGKFIDYLCDAFLFYDVKRYDIRGKKYLASSDKYYVSDVGFRFALLGSRNMDFGHVYENLVYLELIRRGFEVYVGKSGDREIDFVAKNPTTQIYIQVADDISSPKTFEREWTPLLRIKDAYPKMILARTRHPVYTYEGIEIHDLARWLCDANESRQ